MKKILLCIWFLIGLILFIGIIIGIDYPILSKRQQEMIDKSRLIFMVNLLYNIRKSITS